MPEDAPHQYRGYTRGFRTHHYSYHGLDSGVVRVTGKALYYVIASQALASVGTWYYRTRLEKALAGVEGDSLHGDH